MSPVSLLIMAAAAPATGAPPSSPQVHAIIATARTTGPGPTAAALRPLAEAGDASAAEALGEMAQAGLTGDADRNKVACDYFAKAAGARGDAAHNLAHCLLSGAGRTKDDLQARRLETLAMERGFGEAYCGLGNMLVHGWGGKVDVPRGMALCRRGAELGLANAQADYGEHLLNGLAGPRDPVGARQWLTRAAEQQHGDAAYVLGAIYWNGDGIAKDNAEAVKWWTTAQMAHDPRAAFDLGNAMFVRLTAAARPQDADRALLAQAVSLYVLAQTTDPDAARRTQAGERVAMLRQLSAALDAASPPR